MLLGLMRLCCILGDKASGNEGIFKHFAFLRGIPTFYSDRTMEFVRYYQSLPARG